MSHPTRRSGTHYNVTRARAATSNNPNSPTERIPGDMIDYVGHIALYLGPINGTDYMLRARKASTSSRPVVRGGHYPTVARM